MRYRVLAFKTNKRTFHQHPVQLRGKTTVRKKPSLPEPMEPISFFEWEEPPLQDNTFFHRHKKRKKEGFARFGQWLASCQKNFKTQVFRMLCRLRHHISSRTVRGTAALAGALCAAILISVLSAGGVFIGLFAEYGGRYESIRIPNFVGKDFHTVWEADDPSFHLILQHVSNSDVPPGQVISQSPRAGVIRRIYRKDEYCNIVLTVSQEETTYPLTDLTGETYRNALLSLRNAGLSSSVTEIYSDTVPKGIIVTTVPAAGTPLSVGQTVSLTVSLGKQSLLASVPNLWGCNESEAESLLRSAELAVGTVSYETSRQPIGTIIAQSISAYTTVPEGTPVSYTVSAGNQYTIRSMPDLYGMSMEHAQTVLREYGLVIGNTYPIANAAPRNTVITQFPLPGSPLTSSTVSVELYISS